MVVVRWSTFGFWEDFVTASWFIGLLVYIR